jgi:hypothetical protein
MMVFVAVAALALTAEATRRRMADLSAVYRDRGRKHGYEMELASFNIIDCESAFRRGQPPDPKYAKWGAWYRRLAGFHLAMSRKYERVASRPWLPIDPDPAPPEE